MNVSRCNELTGQVIGAAMAVHREFGPGLAEAAYEKLLSAELKVRGILHEYQQPLPLRYKGVKLDCGYRMDLWFPGRLVVELKSVEVLLPVHQAQLLTYLRIAPCELGLLVNFDVPVLKDGVRRMVWTPDQYPESIAPRPGETWFNGHEPLSNEVCAAALEVHRTLGPGLLRSAYEECLCHELAIREIPFERDKQLSIRFHDVEIADAAEIPLLVAGRLPVDCVSFREIMPIHEARLSARLKQGGWPSGLLLNFNVRRMCEGARLIRNNKTPTGLT